MALTVERLRQLLARTKMIKPAPRPIVLPDPTEVRLKLDRTVLRPVVGACDSCAHAADAFSNPGKTFCIVQAVVKRAAAVKAAPMPETEAR